MVVRAFGYLDDYLIFSIEKGRGQRSYVQNVLKDLRLGVNFTFQVHHEKRATIFGCPPAI